MTRKRNYWIPVVAGFLKKDGQILIAQRPKDDSLPGQWEFPGGKIEAGETPEQALARELNEELGIEAEIGDLKMATTHTYDEVGILILFFEVRYWKGAPKTIHHSGLEWIRPSELGQRDIPEANRKMLDKLVKVLEA